MIVLAFSSDGKHSKLAFLRSVSCLQAREPFEFYLRVLQALTGIIRRQHEQSLERLRGVLGKIRVVNSQPSDFKAVYIDTRVHIREAVHNSRKDRGVPVF